MENNKLKHFLQKNNIYINNIKYITRENKKTYIYLTNDKCISCFYTIKALSEILPKDIFYTIKKGTIVSKNYILNIEKNIYTMLDGRIFEGRKRGLSKHKELNSSLNLHNNFCISSVADIQKSFSILDDMPMAFCVIELIINEKHHGVDFIFRYCNKEMEILEGKTLDEMLNHSFYDIFANANRKWLAAYANVALNGIPSTFTSYSPEIQKTLHIRCFQPLEGFCACLLMEVPN